MSGLDIACGVGGFGRLRLHREPYWLWAAIVLVMVILIVRRMQQAGPADSRSS